MAKNEFRRWECKNCGEISVNGALLTAPNPFDLEDILVGCPLCKSVEGFDALCDEPGCNQHSSCGFPAGPEFGGYRNTCFAHSDFAKRKAAGVGG